MVYMCFSEVCLCIFGWSQLRGFNGTVGFDDVLNDDALLICQWWVW